MRMRSRKIERTPISFVDNLLSIPDCEVIVADNSLSTVLYVNSAAMRRYGMESPVGRTFRESCEPHFPGLSAKCHQELESGYYNTHAVQFEVKSMSGETFEVSVGTMAWLDGQSAAVIYLHSVERFYKAQKMLESYAYFDPLTMVPNRRRFLNDFQSMSDKISKGLLTGCVAILDVDNFKEINDTYGHNTGDILLKRLVEHFQSYAEFQGHIYRLGGDEFLFFFAEEAKPRRDAQEYFEQLFSLLSLSYSLPYIEKSCTTSIGIVLFPEFGKTISELMRKADIALYNAKINGKNQMNFFEEKLDTAKKFLDVYVNIQPILSADNTSFGYELMDQGFQISLGKAEYDAPVMCFDRTVDMLRPEDLNSGVKYFLVFNMQLLSPQSLKTITKKNLVVIIFGVQNVSPTLYNNYVKLKESGYTIALDRFSHNTDPRLIELADFIKIDYDMCTDANHARLISAFSSKRLIAKHIDTPQQYERAKAAGYKLFQGFYFCHPVIKKTKVIEPLKLNYLRLLELCSKQGELDMKEISSIISVDMALAYKLLKQLNNVIVGMRNKITSIDLALSYIGESNLRKWSSLLALRGISSDMPLEIVRMSMIRAKFAESLAPMFRPARDSDKLFLHGLLSLLDVAMEIPFESVLSELALNEDISLSLLGDNGPYSDMLALYRNYEYGNWEEVTSFVKRHNLSSAAVSDTYLSAIRWFNDQVRANGLL